MKSDLPGLLPHEETMLGLFFKCAMYGEFIFEVSPSWPLHNEEPVSRFLIGGVDDSDLLGLLFRLELNSSFFFALNGTSDFLGLLAGVSDTLFGLRGLLRTGLDARSSFRGVFTGLDSMSLVSPQRFPGLEQ